jgi:hypothetical protein
MDVAAQRYAVMTTWFNPRAGFPTPYVTVPLMLYVQWVKVGDDCSFLVSYRRKPKGTIVLGSVLKNTSSGAITQPKIIRPERNSNLNCNSSRYSHIPNIKSISQRTSKKGPDNLKFEHKIQTFSFPDFFWRSMRYWFDIWLIAISNI